MKVAATTANQQTQSKAVANNVSQQKSSSRGDSEFVDNRPETKTLQSLQMIINGSPRMAVQRQRGGNIIGGSEPVIKQAKKNVQKKSDPKGVSQRKVVVASPLGGLDKADFTLLSHINWAKAMSNAPVSDLDSDKDWKGVDKDEYVHLVEHGNVGMITGATPAEIANAANTLPKNYAKAIRITSCFSGVQPPKKDSLIDQVKGKMDEEHKNIPVFGVTGPSITNIEAGANPMEVVDPAKMKKAFFYQEALLGKPKHLTDIQIQEAKQLKIWEKHKNMKDNWEIDIGQPPYSTMSIEELSEQAAAKSKAFYEEFIQLLRDNGCLKEVGEQLALA